MLKLILVFLFVWGIVAAAYVSLEKSSSQQKLSVLFIALKSGIAALIAVLLLTSIVLLF